MNLTRLTKNPAIAGARADIQQPEPASPSSTLGDYVIFVDDSGDACLDPIDPRFPMVNLVFCIIKKDHYLDHVVPNLRGLKEEFFWPYRPDPSRIRDAVENWSLCVVARSVGPSTLDDRTACLDRLNRNLSGQRMYR